MVARATLAHLGLPADPDWQIELVSEIPIASGLGSGAALNAALRTIPSGEKVKVVGVVDTNNSPDNIAYVIPGNDDSAKAVTLYVREMADVWLGFPESELHKLCSEAGLVVLSQARVPDAWHPLGPDHHLHWQALVARRPVTSG